MFQGAVNRSEFEIRRAKIACKTFQSGELEINRL
jgi:hypothetical protein